MRPSIEITPERYERLSRVFDGACDCAGDGDACARFLDEACGGDATLRRDVEELLAADRKSGGLLDIPFPDLSSAVTPVEGQIGPYRIETKLGEGGTGTVFRAHDTKLNRPVAIKLLAGDVADAAARRRFQQEARLASSLNHPHILTVLDAGEWEGREYLVAEYLDGKTLRDWVSAEKRTWRQVVELLVGVADGLATAHAAGILHRDIKPGNILIHSSGYAKLADFGSATLEEAAANPVAVANREQPTSSGPVMGTIPYVSPEQAAGKQVDARSDVFSFGIVLHEMLVGQRPFSGASDLEVLQQILHGRPQPLGEEIPAALRMVVERALENDPAARYQSMRQMVEDLRRLTRESAEDLASAMSRPGRRFRSIDAAVALALALVAGGWLVLSSQPPARLEPAPLEYTQLTHFPDSVTSPALSPDGRLLTFIRGSSSFIGAGQVYVKALLDGEPKELTRDDLQKMSPVFSPDGSRITYTTIDGRNEWDTWTLSVPGGAPRPWLPNASGLTWLGKEQMLFSEKIRDSRGNHMKVVVAGQSRADARDLYVPMPRGAMAHRAYPSPDGKWVLIAEMSDRGDWLPCRLVPMDRNSTGRAVGPAGAACWFAAWSPDGQWMYLNARVGGKFHIWRQRFSPGPALAEPVQVTSGPAEEEGIAMAPDGGSFITAVGLQQSSVWVRDANGDRQMSLEGLAQTPRFTPDGKTLVYLRTSGSPGRSELWTAEVDSGRNESLLPGFAVNRSDLRVAYDISPDGRQAVTQALDREGKSRLWLAPLDRRSPPTQIPDVEGDGPLFLSGEEIIFRAREGDYGVAYRVRVDGTALRRASDYHIASTRGVSRDAKWLVVYARPSEHESGVTLALPLRGGPPVQIWGTGTNIQWSLDGRRMYLSVPAGYYSGQSGKTYVLPVPLDRTLPDIPTGGFQSERDIALLPGVQIINSPDATPGPEPEMHAYSRLTVQRNLYQVPVP